MSELNYANIPTHYGGTLFRSRLEARWAAFADLVGWKWAYEPIDFQGWIPDFLFSLPCKHSDCCAVTITKCPKCQSEKQEIVSELRFLKGLDGVEYLHAICARCLSCGSEYPHCEHEDIVFHELYAEVKPYCSIAEFAGHPVTKMEPYHIPSPAMFGLDPSVTEWEMAHGAGGGVYSVIDWVDGSIDVEQLWREAGNLTRYRPPIG